MFPPSMVQASGSPMARAAHLEVASGGVFLTRDTAQAGTI